jgi:hypothetical protein
VTSMASVRATVSDLEISVEFGGLSGGQFRQVRLHAGQGFSFAQVVFAPEHAEIGNQERNTNREHNFRLDRKSHGRSFLRPIFLERQGL